MAAIKLKGKLPPYGPHKRDVNAPTSIGEAVDLLYALREKRLKLSTEAQAYGAAESALKSLIIDAIPKQDLEGAQGKVARCSINRKTVPRIIDWAKFYAYVKKTGEFDLLQRRVSEAAVKARWDAKKAVPGVDAYDLIDLSVTKRAASKPVKPKTK